MNSKEQRINLMVEKSALNSRKMNDNNLALFWSSVQKSPVDNAELILSDDVTINYLENELSATLTALKGR